MHCSSLADQIWMASNSRGERGLYGWPWMCWCGGISEQHLFTSNHWIRNSYGQTQGAGIKENYARDWGRAASNYHSVSWWALFSWKWLSMLHSPTYSGQNSSRIMDSVRNFQTLGVIFFWCIYHCERVIPGQSNLLFLPRFPGIYPNFEQPN